MSHSVYQPLGRKEIRLLTFEKDSNPPAFSLRPRRLRRASGRYICLSYCWGVAVSPHPVLCNGEELQVHANLYDALIQLARRDDAQDYWIDAICINQTDLDEKSFQIQMMGQIFERAASVNVWLGTFSAKEEEDIMQLPNLEPLRQLLKRKTKADIVELMIRWLPPLDSRFWESLSNIFDRSWFRRLWVIQEIALCRYSVVLFGCRTFPFRWLFNAAFIFDHLRIYRLIPSKFAALQGKGYHAFQVARSLPRITAIRTHLLGQRTMSLGNLIHSLLKTMREKEVSNQADRVSGMLGMFKHRFVKKAVTSANSTIAETYQNFAIASLLADRRLSLLHFVSPIRAVKDLPGWCPDL